MAVSVHIAPDSPLATVSPPEPAASSSVDGAHWSRAGMSLLDQAIYAGTTFLTSVIVGRTLSPKDLGVYYLAFTLIMLLRGVQLELTCSPYTVYCHRRAKQNLSVYAGSTLIEHIALTAVGVIGLAVTGFVASLNHNTQLSTLSWIAAAALPFLLLREFIRRIAFAHFQLLTSIVLDASIAVLQLVGLLWLARTGRLSVGATYAVAGIACAVACAVWVFRYRELFSFDRQAWIPDWNHNWSFSRWTLIGFLVGTATPSCLPWLLAIEHGEAAAGMLAACQTLVGFSNMFVTGVGNLLTAQASSAFTHGGVEALWRVLRKTALLYVACLSVFCLVFIFFGNTLLTWIYHGEYAGVGTTLALLALAVLVQSLGVTAGNGLWAIERPRANLAAELVGLTVSLSMAACLIKPFGVFGVAVATLAGATVGTSVRWLTLWRELRVVVHPVPA